MKNWQPKMRSVQNCAFHSENSAQVSKNGLESVRHWQLYHICIMCSMCQCNLRCPQTHPKFWRLGQPIGAQTPSQAVHPQVYEKARNESFANFCWSCNSIDARPTPALAIATSLSHNARMTPAQLEDPGPKGVRIEALAPVKSGTHRQPGPTPCEMTPTHPGIYKPRGHPM